MIDENLWNEYYKLSPQRAKYSADAHTFKKSPRDLRRVAAEEQDDHFRNDMRNLLRQKREASERHSARKLERFIVQYKSNQHLADGVKQQMTIVEQTDPTLFEELSLKRKWSNVAKDPVKGLKDSQFNTNSYW